MPSETPYTHDQKPGLPIDDADLAQAAQAALKWHSQVPEAHVHIQVDKGWITLSGEVDQDYQRRDAEQTVRCLEGVSGVSNCIRLKSAVLPADVHLHLSDGLMRRAQEVARRVEVLVDGSTVVLGGHMDSWAERHAAESACWAVKGVSRVVNNIRVMP
jgi:osmotically-inducible protein OsmY